uniref:ArsA/GET3 Anion-transporting ATPase-like domain-containing protein n=1 Tax=Hanusia phi TaxID=3032 RepID=A0A7S0I2R0_9CRYP|mmetsp:Transcript_8663/g.19652  ORF Transcript_8663/g.19652 Transcript_8663/m.19652 type:complete len:221 (+) Transcript_8663:511-1173(+)
MTVSEVNSPQEYDCIVFDTAPTGHTLRLLSFPTLMENALAKLVTMKAQFGGLFAAMQGMMGASGSSMGSDEDMFSRLESMKQLIEEVNVQFKDPEKTTFVCVCIAEFLSLYETERLVQELAKQGMDTRVIIVNQLVQLLSPARRKELAEKHGISEEAVKSVCLAQIDSRMQMQKKYLDQIAELYEDFHVVRMPLLEHEVRGVDALGEYAKRLLDPHQFEV